MFEDFFPLHAKRIRSRQAAARYKSPQSATLLLKLTSFVWIILVLINKKCNLTAVFVTQKLSYIAVETAAATLIFILLSAKFPLHFERCSAAAILTHAKQRSTILQLIIATAIITRRAVTSITIATFTVNNIVI